jgi:hypothetical protein
MPTLYYVHWNDEELASRMAPLARAGYTVRGHGSTTESAEIRAPYPDALVISLDRLPSHGRAIAEWFWEAKTRQGIPIVFEGGVRDKVQVARARFPKARFCRSGGVLEALERLGLRP